MDGLCQLYARTYLSLHGLHFFDESSPVRGEEVSIRTLYGREACLPLPSAAALCI